ncbi:uncharacterized protein BJ171DRAFT_500745 [Polychytrium aggregatum]|uniref:uncharacterized protein n=1 Tax=Polychytrium aggregatum TaxID=110093 RepID=UPI0022FE6F3E|nr:uncharacterized protein BJ171DRAFT_500745 [Polychytrium aggregatum]KAI9205544.1 hypothetical protein BJ171DRAFT_500745 [Polychytrium aggregatum]
MSEPVCTLNALHHDTTAVFGLGLDSVAANAMPNEDISCSDAQECSTSAPLANVPEPGVAERQGALVHSSLVEQDLLTVLICNDAFLENIDLTTLSRLPQLAKEHKGILALIPSDIWMEYFCRDMGINIDAFKARTVYLEPAHRRLLLEGCYCFYKRTTDLPPGFSSYQKELALWRAMEQSEKLREIAGAILPDTFQSTGGACPCQVAALTPDDLNDLSPAHQFNLMDSSWIAYSQQCSSCRLLSSIFSSPTPTRTIIRFAEHPFHTDEQWSHLLPHETHFLNNIYVEVLHLTNCSFSSLSGWPQVITQIATLCIRDRSETTINMTGMPAMPDLTKLVIESTGRSFEGMPECLPSLIELDISACNNVSSLAGLAQMPQLTSLTLPDSIETLAGMPSGLESLRVLDLSSCSKLSSLDGMPSIPNLGILILPSGIQTLKGMPETLQCLHTLNLRRCNLLTSLEFMASPSSLSVLELPESIESLEGLPSCLEDLKSLDLSHCERLVSLKGMSSMPRLESLELPESLRSLDGMPSDLKQLETLDMSKCCLLSSLKGLHPLPSLKSLKLPHPSEGALSLSDWADWVRSLPEYQDYLSSDGSLASLMPSLEAMWLSTSLVGLDGLDKTFESVKTVWLRSYGDFKSVIKSPPLPALEELWITGPLDNLEYIAEFCGWAKHLHLEEVEGLKSLVGMVEMPLLICLRLPSSIESLEGMPSSLDSLVNFELTICKNLKSLQGLSSMGSISKLELPSSIETLEGMSSLQDLRVLDISKCGDLQSLCGLVSLPSLRSLQLPDSITSLDIASVCLESLVELSLQSCSSLESLQGFPEVPNLEVLVLPQSLKNLTGLPPILPVLKTLRIANTNERSDGATKFEGCPLMPMLECLDLSGSVESLEGLAPTLESLKTLTVGSSLSTELVAGMPQMPNLEKLELHPSNSSAQDLASAIQSYRPDIIVEDLDEDNETTSDLIEGLIALRTLEYMLAMLSLFSN